MDDTGWKERSAFMPAEAVIEATAGKLISYAKHHQLGAVNVTLQGDEPLFFG